MIKPANIMTKASIEYLKNPARFNRITYAAAWGASSTGQALSIAKNKEISAKEKKFLIPQEVSNGVLNIALFSTIALAAENFGKKLTSGADPIIRTKNFIPGSKKHKTFIAGFSAICGIVGGILASDVIITLLRNQIAARIQKNYRAIGWAFSPSKRN